MTNPDTDNVPTRRTELESARLRVRERYRSEIQDLTFLFVRANRNAFVRLTTIWAVPITLITYGGLLLIDQYADRLPGPSILWKVYLAFVLLCTLAPIIRLPYLALAADLMFVEDPPLRAVWSRLRRLAVPLASEYLLWRLFLAMTIVGVISLGWANRYFFDEVIVLEDVPPKELRSRLRHLHRPAQLTGVGAMLSNAMIGTFLMVSFWALWLAIAFLFMTSFDPVAQFTRVCGPPLVIGFVLVQIYCGLTKFLFYLNHRTTYEGWDVFLQVRRVLMAWDNRPFSVLHRPTPSLTVTSTGTNGAPH